MAPNPGLKHKAHQNPSAWPACLLASNGLHRASLRLLNNLKMNIHTLKKKKLTSVTGKL